MAKMKKFALNNSYFKNRTPDMPGTPFEIVKYYQVRQELPFEYSGENWIYDMFIEYQKRSGIYFEQFLTPDKTAQAMVDLLAKYVSNNSYILEIGCGTGQITKYLSGFEYHQGTLTKLIAGFNYVTMTDIAYDMLNICNQQCNVLARSWRQINEDYRTMLIGKYHGIITNPPYSDIPTVLSTIHCHLNEGGIAVILLPVGTFQKERPKRLVDFISKFDIVEQIPMKEEFKHTKVRAEITVLKKK